MFKYTQHLLDKLEDLLNEAGYVIRYEKGNFKSGYCILENKNVAVVNKFFDVESRINALIDITSEIEIDETLLSEPSKKLLIQVLQTRSER
jgi:hypothetical protein